MPVSEPLEDPEKLAREAVSEARRKNENMDVQLAPMHCVSSFVEFLERKGSRAPAFLTRALDIRARLEAESAAAESAASKHASQQVSPAPTDSAPGAHLSGAEINE